MDYLWTPWRYAYVTGDDHGTRPGVPPSLAAWPDDKHCVFCNLHACASYAAEHGMALEDAERAAHIVARYRHCFICLNAFPYASGHIMVIPYEHRHSLSALAFPVTSEMMAIARLAEASLQQIYKPHGINLGMNLGKAAGAGVEEHIHLHILPRWLGDTNFMTVVGETRVLPETLDVTWERLRSALAHHAPERSDGD